MHPPVHLLVSWLFGWLVGVGLSQVPPKRAKSFTSMLQSEHLVILIMDGLLVVKPAVPLGQNRREDHGSHDGITLHRRHV